MNRRKLAVVLVVVGLVLLPAPLYLGWAAEATAPPPRTSQVYAAEPMDLDDEGDRQQILDRYWSEVAFSAHQVSDRYSAEEYRSPNATREALRTAMRDGDAAVADDGARADLRDIAAEYAYLTDTYTDIEGYYRLSVAENGSVVRAERVSEDRIVNETVEQAPRHSELGTGEQRTVDRVLNNGTEGYRPRVDDPYADRLPTLVWKDGTLYGIYVSGHVDDFGPGFGGFVAGLVATAVGLVLVLAGAVLYALTVRRA
jgi:hypothetical protein